MRPVFPPLPASGDNDLRGFKFLPFEPGGETTPQGLDLSRQLIQLFTPKLLQDLKLKQNNRGRSTLIEIILVGDSCTLVAVIVKPKHQVK